jgi:hypothetical protein
MSRFLIPPEIIEVFHNFRTTELSTIAKDGTALTWPVTTAFDEPACEFIAFTSIGLPQKAYNIRRNPKVSMLFSEPKASGLKNPPAVLVQGDATVSENITTLEGLELSWEKIFRFQPSAKATHGSALSRYLMDWYYLRLKIVVRPQTIRFWENGDFSKPAKELEHVE